MVSTDLGTPMLPWLDKANAAVKYINYCKNYKLRAVWRELLFVDPLWGEPHRNIQGILFWPAVEGATSSWNRLAKETSIAFPGNLGLSIGQKTNDRVSSVQGTETPNFSWPQPDDRSSSSLGKKSSSMWATKQIPMVLHIDPQEFLKPEC